MKKILLFTPLIIVIAWAIAFPICLSSCSALQDNEVITNVMYEYDYDTRHYLVYKVNEGNVEKTYRVPPKNYYYIEIKEWKYDETTKSTLQNEYLVKSNELFVYFRK